MGKERALEADILHQVVLRLAGILDWLMGGAHAGIVKRMVEPAETPQHAGDAGFDAGLAGHVQAERRCRASGMGDPTHELLHLLGPPRRQSHDRARLGKQLGGGCPDAARGARDQNHMAREGH